MNSASALKLALLWHGGRADRNCADLESSHLRGVAHAFRAVGVETVAVVYTDASVSEAREQLSEVDGVLVWVNPIEQGCDRTILDGLLREIAAKGVFVSAHPDTILKMGTKEVLFSTRDMSWGSETYRYSTLTELREQLPLRLAAGEPRVLKQHRGNGGSGVWKVEPHPLDPTLVRVRHALRGNVEQDISFGELLALCETYFKDGGCVVDQAYQERLVDGMVRCYLVGNRVAGFGHQEINALFPAPPGAAAEEAPQPTPRLYYPPSTPDFHAIKTKMEEEWLDALCTTLRIDAESLPMLWDADLLYGPKTAAGEDTYVLCEINVSSVYPFPESALEPLALETRQRLVAGR